MDDLYLIQTFLMSNIEFFELLNILTFISELAKEEFADILRSNKIVDKMQNTDDGNELIIKDNIPTDDKEISKVRFKLKCYVTFRKTRNFINGSLDVYFLVNCNLLST